MVLGNRSFDYPVEQTENLGQIDSIMLQDTFIEQGIVFILVLTL